MTSEEHKKLSTYIKNTHLSLRKRSRKIGFDLAWKEHCSDETNLEKYALSMKKLATYWKLNEKINPKVVSRIKWTNKFCQEYFFGEELNKQRRREIEILGKLGHLKEECVDICEKYKCLKLLDVGSCYNPFQIFEYFDVLAIDIAPACENVYKCDFINMSIGDHSVIKDKSIDQLKRNEFQVVVFSLLLEYLPSPEQRLLCCKKAYDLLKAEGILIIITPDSKHVGANVKYMKSWRYVLSTLGFSRIKYEKLPYLHCMVFRKCYYHAVAERWAQLNENKNLFNVLHIPQDFQECFENVEIQENKDICSCNNFYELPFNDEI